MFLHAYVNECILLAINFRDKKSSWKEFSREAIFANLALIRKSKFREIYQKFLIPENFIREIKQKYPFAKINSPQNDSFQNKFSGNRIVFYIINGSKSKQIQNF